MLPNSFDWHESVSFISANQGGLRIGLLGGKEPEILCIDKQAVSLLHTTPEWLDRLITSKSGLEVFDNPNIDASVLPDLIDLNAITRDDYEKFATNTAAIPNHPYQLPEQSEHIPEIPLMYYQGLDGSCGFNTFLNILEQFGFELDQEFIESLYKNRDAQTPYSNGLSNIAAGVTKTEEDAILKMLSDNLNSTELNFQKFTSNSETKILETNARELKTAIDGGAKVYMSVEAGTYRNNSQNGTHIIAAVGYRINTEGMEILLIDSAERKPVWISLEHLSFSLHQDVPGVRSASSALSILPVQNHHA